MSFLFRLDLPTDHELNTMNSPPRPPISWKGRPELGETQHSVFPRAALFSPDFGSPMPGSIGTEDAWMRLVAWDYEKSGLEGWSEDPRGEFLVAQPAGFAAGRFS